MRIVCETTAARWTVGEGSRKVSTFLSAYEFLAGTKEERERERRRDREDSRLFVSLVHAKIRVTDRNLLSFSHFLIFISYPSKEKREEKEEGFFVGRSLNRQ